MTAPQFVSLVHLGCARNLIDSELILGRMAEEGLVITDDAAAAHTVVLNTCSFIGPAREESENAIRDLVAKKRAGEIRGVVVAGCLVQRYRRRLREQFPDVDSFAEISDYRELARNVRRLVDGKKIPDYLEGPLARSPEREGARLLSTPGSFSYLRISHGCDHTCSFCTIPSIRGAHRSKSIEVLTGEARELAEFGVRELVLVAEDSTAWGRDIGLELPDLIEALGEVEGVERIRLMYADPNRFPWRLTELLRDHPRVVPYLDIPVQHFSTPVLRAMRRAGSGDQVRGILSRLLEEVPELTLRTTVMLGFPGETEEDVERVIEGIHEFKLARLGAFTYSDEDSTPAFELGEKVPEDVARARYERVLDARDEVLMASQRARIGKTLEILIDEPRSAMDAPLVGRPASDAPEVDLIALVEDSDAKVGETVRARVEEVDEAGNLVCRAVGARR